MAPVAWPERCIRTYSGVPSCDDARGSAGFQRRAIHGSRGSDPGAVARPAAGSQAATSRQAVPSGRPARRRGSEQRADQQRVLRRRTGRAGRGGWPRGRRGRGRRCRCAARRSGRGGGRGGRRPRPVCPPSSIHTTCMPGVVAGGVLEADAVDDLRAGVGRPRRCRRPGAASSASARVSGWVPARMASSSARGHEVAGRREGGGAVAQDVDADAVDVGVDHDVDVVGLDARVAQRLQARTEALGVVEGEERVDEHQRRRACGRRCTTSRCSATSRR